MEARMIVELVGLPGTGKTSLAEAMKTRGAKLVPLPPREFLLAHAFLFWLAHPSLACELLFYLLKKAPPGVRYELFVNGYLGYAARYRVARLLSRQERVVVLDQGFSQLLISLHGLSSTLLKQIPKPELLVVVADGGARLGSARELRHRYPSRLAT